ncbi:DUF4259 domain-containing protein [Nocardia donostiensis]|uniref:DUF4259 domain-containing protein n=1 Tax=Nocardia donostiensis TaxID=1538463 RepID=A0A1W0BH78_9NOCA|nr:DUF4259 domain-containing protein [Nocardia donostiensis]ONM49285.1 hypothetical protein B0T46_07830 [Nocardia donostiensis]OQS14805.1 hypothetical protein B0T36_12090 [Nocardia donostiensis]OQS21808.1 hypothetical protein B0T44_06785 [Nocardia donostiensis]
MGTWGEGLLDSDGAHDALDGLRDVDSSTAEARVREMCGYLLESEYADCYDAQGVIGIAVLSTHLCAPNPGDTDIDRLAAGIQLTPTPELRLLLLRCLSRIQDPADNEWFDLWEDTGNGVGTEMIRSLDRYRDALAAWPTVSGGVSRS